MSLDVYLTKVQPTEVYSANITHNLGEMAKAAGIYQHLWHPEDIGMTKAVHLVAPLRSALDWLKGSPAYFEKYNPKNGLGTYQDFVQFVEKYMMACASHPDAEVKASR